MEPTRLSRELWPAVKQLQENPTQYRLSFSWGDVLQKCGEDLELDIGANWLSLRGKKSEVDETSELQNQFVSLFRFPKRIDKVHARWYLEDQMLWVCLPKEFPNAAYEIVT